MVINNKWGKNKTEVLRPQVLQQDLISKTVNRQTGNSSVKTRSEVKANQYNNIYTSKCMMTTGFCRNGSTKYMEYLCACQSRLSKSRIYNSEVTENCIDRNQYN